MLFCLLACLPLFALEILWDDVSAKAQKKPKPFFAPFFFGTPLPSWACLFGLLCSMEPKSKPRPIFETCDTRQDGFAASLLRCFAASLLLRFASIRPGDGQLGHQQREQFVPQPRGGVSGAAEFLPGANLTRTICPNSTLRWRANISVFSQLSFLGFKDIGSPVLTGFGRVPCPCFGTT